MSEQTDGLIPIELHNISMRVWMKPDEKATKEKAKEVLEFIQNMPEKMRDGAILERLACMISGQVNKLEIHGSMHDDQQVEVPVGTEIVKTELTTAVTQAQQQEELLESESLRGWSCKQLSPEVLSAWLVRTDLITQRDQQLIIDYLNTIEEDKARGIVTFEEDDVPF